MKSAMHHTVLTCRHVRCGGEHWRGVTRRARATRLSREELAFGLGHPLTYTTTAVYNTLDGMSCFGNIYCTPLSVGSRRQGVPSVHSTGIYDFANVQPEQRLPRSGFIQYRNISRASEHNLSENYVHSQSQVDGKVWASPWRVYRQ